MRIATSTVVQNTLLLALLFASPLLAQQIKEISPRGLTLGGSTRVTIKGDGFDASSQVILQGDVWIASDLISVSENELQLVVSLRNEVQPGIMPLLIATEDGISNPVMVGVDRLLQQDFTDQVDSLPVALHGELAGDQVLSTTFFARTGDSVVIDIEGQRLGSKLRPLMRVFSPSNRQVLSARPSSSIHGDARAVVQVVETGSYRVEIQDLLFKGAKPGWFRLKIGQLAFADTVFPLAVGSHANPQLQLIGSNISTASNLTRLALLSSRANRVQVRWDEPGAPPRTGIGPCVRLSDFGDNEITESEAMAQTLQAPVGINGRILKSGEIDEYRIGVRPGTNMEIELYANRWGSPLDATLQVLDAAGKSLLNSDDRDRTTDPGGEFKVPDGSDYVRVRVSNITGQAGPEQIYRLALQKKQPTNVTLSVDSRALNLPSGGRVVVPVAVQRKGSADISLQLPNELRGLMHAESGRIAPEDERGLWAITASPMSRGLFAIFPRGYIDDGTDSIPLMVPGFPGADHQPVYREQLLVRLTDSNRLAVNMIAPQSDYLPRGGRLPVDVYLSQSTDDPRPVRLSLLTTQTKRTKKQDNKDVPAPEQELRIAETIVDASKKHARIDVLVPNDLPLHSWAFAVRAEALADDRKTAVASAVSSILRLDTIEPLRIEAQLPEQVQTKAGNAYRLTGKVNRHLDFAFPIKIELAGVPGVTASVIVPMGSNEFELAYTIPADAKEAEHKGAMIVATSAVAAPQTAEIRAQTKAFTVRVIPAK